MTLKSRTPLGQTAPDCKSVKTIEASQNVLRVLIVDDNRSAVFMLSALAKKLGNEVRTANDGLQAIEAAAEFRPHLVLMDLRMPNMDGCAAAQHIREQPWGKAMKLVAVTGSDQQEDLDRTQQAGFDHHLVKPISTDDLKQLFSCLN